MLRPLLLCLLASIVSACATQKPLDLLITDESHEQWQTRQQQLKTLDDWSIRGRAAIFVKDEVHNVGLNWQRHGDISSLKLEAPFNQGVILLEKNNEGVKLTTTEGEQYTGRHSQQLLYQTTGLIIPIEGLETWIKGIPHQRSAYLPDIDAQGRASNIQQDGWSINYLEYEQVAWEQQKNPTLPRKLYMKHDGLALKIVIDQWQNMATDTIPDIFPDFDLKPTQP